MRIDTPQRPAEYLLGTREVVAFRVRGNPRDVEKGRHREVVIFAQATMSPSRLATYLRAAADALEPT